jgi:hypothetical protein
VLHNLVLFKEIELDFIPTAGLNLTIIGDGFTIINTVYNPDIKIATCCLKHTSYDPYFGTPESGKLVSYFLNQGWKEMNGELPNYQQKPDSKEPWDKESESNIAYFKKNVIDKVIAKMNPTSPIIGPGEDDYGRNKKAKETDFHCGISSPLDCCNNATLGNGFVGCNSEGFCEHKRPQEGFYEKQVEKNKQKINDKIQHIQNIIEEVATAIYSQNAIRAQQLRYRIPDLDDIKEDINHLKMD